MTMERVESQDQLVWLVHVEMEREMPGTEEYQMVLVLCMSVCRIG
jgi:hypothetical protein